MSVNMLPKKYAFSHTANSSLRQSILVSEVEETLFSMITLTHHHLPRLQNNLFFFFLWQGFSPSLLNQNNNKNTLSLQSTEVLTLFAQLKRDLEYHLLLSQCKQQAVQPPGDCYFKGFLPGKQSNNNKHEYKALTHSWAPRRQPEELHADLRLLPASLIFEGN